MTVREMEARMGSREITEWRCFFEIQAKRDEGPSSDEMALAVFGNPAKPETRATQKRVGAKR